MVRNLRDLHLVFITKKEKSFSVIKDDTDTIYTKNT